MWRRCVAATLLPPLRYSPAHPSNKTQHWTPNFLHSFFFPYEYHMDLCDELRLSGRPAGGCLSILRGQNLNIRRYAQTFQQFFFVSAMLKGIRDLYHFIPLSLTLTLPEGHKVSAEQSLLASFSHTHFNWYGWNVIWCWSSLSGTPWYCIWIRFNETREITAVLLTVSNDFNIGLHSDVYQSI